MSTHNIQLGFLRGLTVASAVAAAAVLAACGGGGGGGHSSSTSSASTSTTSTTAKVGRHRPLAEKVVIAKSHVPADVAASAKAGDEAVFLTLLPGNPQGKPETVRLTLTRGPAKKLTATATVAGRKASASVTSSSGKAITLFEPHYSCTLPPTPGFCPARQSAVHGHQITTEFTARPAMPVTVSATIGPVAGTSAQTGSPGTLSVPPYQLKELVLTRSAGAPASSPPQPSTTASAKPGDTVVLRTRLTGAKNGAPQPLTIDFDQGPSKSLTVSASVPGSSRATATITSGSAIALVEPHFSCFLPPTPTFCPPTKVAAKAHHYMVTVKASPLTSVAIEAVAQRG